MAIDNNNEKLALIHYHQPFQPAAPISSDGLGQADNQQLLWEYPGLLWSDITVVPLEFIFRNKMYTNIIYQNIDITKTTTVKTVLYNNVVFGGVNFEDL